MNIERIKEIQQETAYPDSVSVQQAQLKVWNESEQEKAVKNNAVLPLVMGELTCDNCGCHPNVIYTTSKGRFCERCKPAS